MARLAMLLAVLALLAPVPGAFAQTDPFGPIQATPTPDDNSTSVLGQDVGRQTLYLIAGAFFVAFVGIGWWISRDARRAIVREHPEAPAHVDPKERGKARERAKTQARAKAKRQRAARKTTRKRKR